MFASGLDELEHVEIEWAPFDDALMYGLLGSLPRLRSLTKSGRTQSLRVSGELFELEELERLEIIWRNASVPERAWPKLRELDLSIGPHNRGLVKWRGWEGWERLESFTLTSDYSAMNWRDVSDSSVRASVDALVDVLERAHELKRLSIRVTLNPEDLERVLELESLSNLESLDIDHAHSKGKVGRALFAGIASERDLEELRLTDCGLNEALAAKMTYPASVRRLDVSGKNKLGERGARALSACEGAEVAWLERVGLGPAGGAALAEGAFGQNVRALDVSANKLGAKGLEGLLSREWPRLESLWLGQNGTGNELDADAMRVLADWEGLANLRFLSLISERMRGEAMEALLSSPHLKNLEVLDISGNTMTKAAAEALAQIPCAPKLRALGVGFTGLSTSPGWGAFVEGEWSSLELLYCTDESMKVAAYEQVTRALSGFPVLELIDVGSKLTAFLDSRSRRDDPTEYGFTEDGVFPYALSSIGYRGISEVHSRSWMEPREATTRQAWWDVVSR